LGDISRLEAAAADFEERTNNFAHHVTQERFPAHFLEPLVGPGGRFRVKGSRFVTRAIGRGCDRFGPINREKNVPVELVFVGTARGRDRGKVVLALEEAGDLTHPSPPSNERPGTR
jgi:hypothetical protein